MDVTGPKIGNVNVNIITSNFFLTLFIGNSTFSKQGVKPLEKAAELSGLIGQELGCIWGSFRRQVKFSGCGHLRKLVYCCSGKW
jgi:hypothetical protein